MYILNIGRNFYLKRLSGLIILAVPDSLDESHPYDSPLLDLEFWNLLAWPKLRVGGELGFLKWVTDPQIVFDA